MCYAFLDMLYRIIIHSNIRGKVYYLSSDKTSPETDVEVNLDKIEFLSKLNSEDAHTFSSEEVAKEVINSLPFPYNQKASTLAVNSVYTPIVSTIFYRVAKKAFNKNAVLWANPDKSFTESINNDCLIFSSQEEAETFISSLKGLNKRYSYVSKIKDYGEPDYKFDAEYFVKDHVVYDISELPGIIRLK
jgi:hypothetical protein